MRGSMMITHISHVHGIKSKEYKERYPDRPLYNRKYLEDLSKRVSGSNNPAYQHGGRLSPWSKKSSFYSEESKKAAASNRVNNTELQYYLNKGLSEEDAEKALRERQVTFSLEKCIAKYGEEEGRARWESRQEKWQNSLKEKSDEERARINRAKLSAGSVSKAEKNLVKIFAENGIDVETQFSLFEDGKKSFVFDIRHGNKLIEYNGDYWHCNPKKFDESFYNDVSKMTASEIWERDRQKAKLAEDRGFEVLVVWETDMNKDPRGTVESCLNFLRS